MTLNIRLLGPLMIEEVPGTPSDLMTRPKSSALLAYLVMADHPQSRERVADLLWDAPSTTHALQNLRKLLSRMRDQLPELEVSRTQIAYPAQDTDYHQLVAALASDDVAIINEGLRHYRGDLLTDFHLHTAPRFNEWLLVEREHLRHRVVKGYRRICTVYAEREDWSKGIDAAQRWLRLDELDEEALRHLLKLLVVSGQVEVAMRQYEVSRQQLWRELAVDPEPETVQLAQQLGALKADTGGGPTWAMVVGAQLDLPESDQLAEPGPVPTSSYLPYRRNDDFIGRQDILLDLAAHLLPRPEPVPWPPVVALTGIGGVGKTQVAVEFAYRYGRYFPGGVYWMNFAEPTTVASEVAAIGGERGMGLYRDTEQLTLVDRAGRVRRGWQEPVPRLLIFDNCDDETLLDEWLPVTGGARVLLTSRRGQWSTDLALSPVMLGSLSTAHSTALLQKLHPALDDANAAAISREVGGLPLALHLAGSFMRRYTQVRPADYLAQLREQGVLNHPSLQGLGVERSPTGHDLHVARTFAVIVARLESDDEADQLARRLLAHLAAFVPGEPVARELLVATFLDENEEPPRPFLVEDGLIRLIDLGLVTLVDLQTVTIHRLVAAYARAFLDGMVEAERAVERTVTRRLDQHILANSSLFRLPLARAHVHYLLEKALPRSDTDAADLAYLFGTHLHHIADYAASEEILERGLAIYERVRGVEHPDTSKYLIALAALYSRSGDYGRSRATWERILQSREEKLGIEDTQTALALNNLAHLLILQGDYASAWPLLERAIPMHEAHTGPEHPRTATAWNNLGTVRLAFEDYERARACLEKGLAIRERTNGPDHPFTAVSLQNMGTLHLRLGNADKARRYFERALDVRERALGENHPHTARSLNALAEYHLTMGELEAARACLDRAIAIQDAVLPAEHPEKGQTQMVLGDLYLASRDTDRAIAAFERAVALTEGLVVPTHPALQHARARLETLRNDG